jgi:hypothetical protein
MERYVIGWNVIEHTAQGHKHILNTAYRYHMVKAVH